MSDKYDYEQFKKKLEEEHTFPVVFMFKFIVPSDNQKIALVESLFTEEAHCQTGGDVIRRSDRDLQKSYRY